MSILSAQPTNDPARQALKQFLVSLRQVGIPTIVGPDFTGKTQTHQIADDVVVRGLKSQRLECHRGINTAKLEHLGVASARVMPQILDSQPQYIVRAQPLGGSVLLFDPAEPIAD